MSDTTTISVALSAEQLAVMDAAVRSGAYATIGEIVREALGDWQVRQALRERDIQTLQRLWREGKASGAAGPFDIERTITAAQLRLTRAAAE